MMVDAPTAEVTVSADSRVGEPGARSVRTGIRLDRLAIFVLIFEALTGLGLMFHYRPTVEHATLDLIDLREVSRSSFVRGLHHWGAQAAWILVWLHFSRLALRGAYALPRQRHWTAGIVLMLLTLALMGTGYLLPWDQEAYWGLATLSPRGEASFDGSTLLQAYIWHCVGLPLLIVGLTVYHLRREHSGAKGGAPSGD